ncbi:arylsulfatase B-like [Glandiceps talaboti]
MTVTSLLGLLYFLMLPLASASTQPNIVYILADDLGWDDVGYHGSVMKTPNIDNLASNGVQLDNYYMPSLCTPSRSVLLTGRYETHTGLQHGTILMMQPLCLPLDEVTLPQKLQQYGYSTHMVGKWHLGFYKKECLPNYRGFQSFLGFYQAMGDYYHHNVSTGPFNAWDFRRDDDVIANEYAGKYSTHVFAEEAQRIIENHDNSNPLFLYLSFQAVHTPLQVPSRYSDLYKDLIPDNEERRIYAGMTTCMDEAIGNVTRTLQQTGLWENTVLIFSTDNGGLHLLGSNWPLRGGKGTLYEGGVKGVGFVTSSLLGDHVRGTSTKELIHISDWFPTLVRLAGGTLIGNKKLDGYNQWETISQGAPSVRQEMLLHLDPMYTAIKNTKNDRWAENKYFNISMRAAIRKGEWKLITGAAGNNSWMAPPESENKSIHPESRNGKVVQLYNIDKDPNEQLDIADDNPDIVTDLLQRLERYYQDSVPPYFPQQDVKHANPALYNNVWSPWE